MTAVADERRHPFFMIEKRTCRLLAEHFDGRRLPIARSLYFALVEMANDARGAAIEKPRKAVAERAGITPRTLDEYSAELEALGLVRVERVRKGEVNLPNRWILTDAPEGGAADARGGAADDTTPGAAAAPGGGAADRTPIQEEQGTTSPAGQEQGKKRARRAVSYRGQVVKPVFVDRAVAALDLFCELTGRSVGAWSGDGKPSPALKQVLGAVIARPDVRFAEWERGLRAFVAAPPEWAAGGPLQVGQVFGERAAEWALAAGARAEVAAGPPAGPAARGGGQAAAVQSTIERLDREIAEAQAAEAAAEQAALAVDSVDGEIVEGEVVG